MTPQIHAAQDDLSEALSLVTDERQRVCVRHAINRLERAYRDAIAHERDLAVRAAIRERDTLPAPAPRGPDLAPVLQASLDQLSEQKRRA